MAGRKMAVKRQNITEEKKRETKKKKRMMKKKVVNGKKSINISLSPFLTHVSSLPTPQQTHCHAPGGAPRLPVVIHSVGSDALVA